MYVIFFLFSIRSSVNSKRQIIYVNRKSTQVYYTANALSHEYGLFVTAE